LPARYFAPLLAADIITPDPDDPFGFAWAYPPVAGPHGAERWASETLHVVRDAPDDDTFLEELNATRMPHHTAAGRAQYFGCYLLLRPSGTYSFFMHIIHAIVDGRQNLLIVRRVLEDVTNATGLAFGSIKYGDDVANLPLDIVHAIGEEKFRAAQRKGIVFPPEVRDNKVCPS
jgi:hypothetical protein